MKTIDLEARRQLQAVMDKEPLLTDFGIGILEPMYMTTKQYNDELDNGRKQLIKRTKQFVATCEWLDCIEKRKTINSNTNSYGLKHVAEKDVGYITNGIFIAAAIHKGFKYKKYKDSPNVSFNMTEKSVDRQYRRIYE